jgi:hypothetical protein
MKPIYLASWLFCCIVFAWFLYKDWRNWRRAANKFERMRDTIAKLERENYIYYKWIDDNAWRYNIPQEDLNALLDLINKHNEIDVEPPKP